MVCTGWQRFTVRHNGDSKQIWSNYSVHAKIWLKIFVQAPVPRVFIDDFQHRELIQTPTTQHMLTQLSDNNSRATNVHHINLFLLPDTFFPLSAVPSSTHISLLCTSSAASSSAHPEMTRTLFVIQSRVRTTEKQFGHLLRSDCVISSAATWPSSSFWCSKKWASGELTAQSLTRKAQPTASGRQAFHFYHQACLGVIVNCALEFSAALSGQSKFCRPMSL